MTVDFLLILIFVALVSLNLTLDKIAKVLQKDHLDSTRAEDDSRIPGNEF
jgi:hypothetical protein